MTDNIQDFSIERIFSLDSRLSYDEQFKLNKQLSFVDPQGNDLYVITPRYGFFASVYILRNVFGIGFLVFALSLLQYFLLVLGVLINVPVLNQLLYFPLLVISAGLFYLGYINYMDRTLILDSDENIIGDVKPNFFRSKWKFTKLDKKMKIIIKFQRNSGLIHHNNFESYFIMKLENDASLFKRITKNAYRGFVVDDNKKDMFIFKMANKDTNKFDIDMTGDFDQLTMCVFACSVIHKYFIKRLRLGNK